MFADFLHSINDDANDAEGIAQLVVTALGTSGRHYMCWKTRAGEYKQRSNGLPRQLQEWLFPADGSTRDFETLQVVLSGEDEFWASDKYGDIRSDSTDAQKQLRRSLTFTDETLSSVNRRRLSRSRDLSREAERPRSSTLPSFVPTASPPSGKVPRMQVNHDRTPSVDKLRRQSTTPPAVQQKRRWTSRPRSIGYMGLEELAVLKEIPSPQHAGAPPPSNLSPLRGHVPNRHCSCGCHRSSTSSIQAPPAAVTRPRPAYADACVQTEPSPEPSPLEEYNFQHHRISSVTTISSGEEFETGSQRSSFETTITRPDPEALKASWDPPLQNPIIMGRMQDYFRSTTYILGQALHPRGY